MRDPEIMISPHYKYYIVITILFAVASSMYAADSTYLITKDGIGEVKLGMKYDEVARLIKYDKVDSNESGLFFYHNNTRILSITDNYANKIKVVRLVSTMVPLFHSADGIYAGMKVGDFLKRYPKEPLYLDEEFGCYFMPAKLRMYEDGNPEVRTYFYVTKIKLPKNVDYIAMKSKGITNYKVQGLINIIVVAYTQ